MPSFKRFCLLSLLLLVVSCTSHKPSNNAAGNFPDYQSATAYPEWYDPTTIDTLNVVTWNIEHFVDEHDNPYIDNGRENNPSDELPERRKTLAKALKAIDADVVIFQELESDSYLRMFADKYLSNMGYEVFAALESPDWYMNVVMMSRVPMGLFHSYAHINTPIPGQTDDEGNPASQTFINNRMWTADLLVNDNYQLTLTGVHLKAGRGDRNRAWREGQINLLRNHHRMLMAQNPQRNMVVMGDLNSTPDSPEFQMLLGSNPPRYTDPLAGTGIFSHPSDSAFWRIDHILPNRQAAAELVPNSVEVIRPLTDEKMSAVSDHLPLRARFLVRDL